MKKVDVCPSTLAVGFDKYSPAAIRKLFSGKRVSHNLNFDYDADSIGFSDVINQISVSDRKSVV